MSDTFLGLDLGTSSLKAALWSDQGEPIAEAEAAYPIEHPGAGWAQTPVEQWRRALVEVTEKIAGALGVNQVAAIGIDGQMHGLVLADDHGAALAPALLWSDQRAAGLMDRWRCLDRQSRARLANPLVPGMTGPLLAWVGEHQPDLIKRSEVALLPKDGFRSLLVPSPVTDRSDASATLLWDVPGERWDTEVAGAVGIDERLLPPVVSSARVVGTTGWLAEVVDGTPDVPVVAGTADTPVARLALRAGPGVQVNLGSGGQVLAPVQSAQAALDPLVHTYADTATGWYQMAAVQNAGLALDWVCGVLGMSFDDLFGVAERASPGSGGVIFLPFVHGERGGVAGPDARAGWLGAGARTGRAELARAAIEGVLFAMRRASGLVDIGADGPVVLTGGGGRAPLVQQTLATLLGREIHRYEVRSASATGAAILAARGVGHELVPEQAEPTVVAPGQGAALDLDYGRWVQWCDRGH